MVLQEALWFGGVLTIFHVGFHEIEYVQIIEGRIILIIEVFTVSSNPVL